MLLLKDDPTPQETPRPGPPLAFFVGVLNAILITLGMIAIAVFFWLFISAAFAAQVELYPIDYDTASTEAVTVKLTGPIARGDLKQLREAYGRASRDGYVPLALELRSWGGDGEIGMAIAKYVADHQLTVLVTDDCWSACAFSALVALGNGRLLIAGNARLGLHQATRDDTNRADPEWTNRAARRLRSWGAPAEPLRVMCGVPPGQMMFYEYADLLALGSREFKRPETEGGWWPWQ